VDQRNLGREGLVVSELGLGCKGMSEFYGTGGRGGVRAPGVPRRERQRRKRNAHRGRPRQHRGGHASRIGRRRALRRRADAGRRPL